MKSEYKNIERFFDVVSRSLFRSTSKLGYKRTLESIERLAQEVLKRDTNEIAETMLYMGEGSEATLDAVIAGAYWFLADYHGGQNSLEYRVLSTLGEIYNPGMTSGPEPESSEKDVYEMLERLYNEAHSIGYEYILRILLFSLDG